ncbi:prion-like-(Q/N-rich) domain-bearing protein 25 [Schistocerca nitens]|uniref:prion-like-(Q/N-rich) domain-bearing protein 25 n=1 Tax=Schistocerca nitens TaxID=7011 RepID=UPI0021178607|nr:prion-like-(Q/N-rich) domain-bearing protein 25 [Schistocerca nitens]
MLPPREPAAPLLTDLALTLLLALPLLLTGAACAVHHPAQLRRGQIDCRYDEDCIPNAYCKEQKYCLCKVGAFAYTLSNGSTACLKAATTVGDPCSLNEQCVMNLSENSACDSAGRCQCREDAHFVEGRCHRTSRAGESCRVSNDCHIDNPNVMLSCLYQVCVCPQQYRPVNNGSDCVRTLELGQNCDTDEECITEGAVCKDVCHCTVHHEISQDGRHCLLAAEVLESPCQEDAQCAKYIEFSKCQSGLCVCEDDYHYTSAKSKCWRNIGLNERCSDSAECVLKHGNDMAAICSVSGVCQCMKGYEPTSDNSDCRSGAAVDHPTLFVVPAVILLLSLR